MRKTIALFGAGTGLGVAMARHFGGQGYQVALVARRRAPLESVAAELAQDGIKADLFPGDLSNSDGVPAIVAAIEARFDTIDAVYYAPNPNFAFQPAFAFTPDYARTLHELLFTSMVAVVQAVLPGMRARGEGDILVGLGGSAAGGYPFMSGPGPAMAAARNYLQSLQGELFGEGIRVGMATITAFIRNSATAQAVASGAFEIPKGMVVPEADPVELTQLLVTAAARGQAELVFPAR